MHFHLTLTSQRKPTILPLNYQYPFSSVIYKILDKADSDYATFLHEVGYRKDDGSSLKSFKFFTFSDIKTKFKVSGDRMMLLTSDAQVIISFHLPQAAEHFIRGLFLNQQIDIADQKSRAHFTINHVTVLSGLVIENHDAELILHPISPVVCGLKNEKGNYDFLSPDHEQFIPQLIHNWKEKYIALYGSMEAEEDFKEVLMLVKLYEQPFRSRLITIKAGTNEETKIKGYMNFKLEVKAKTKMLELLLNAGVGLYNSMGCGCVEVK